MNIQVNIANCCLQADTARTKFMKKSAKIDSTIKFSQTSCASGDFTGVENPNNVDTTSKFEIHKTETIFMAAI
jgi:hypothetical protein